MEKASLVDARVGGLLRRFLPTCSMNDRASTARAAARLVVGLLPGDDDPTCAEHALVNILEAGRKAMDSVLREMMNISDAQAEGVTNLHLVPEARAADPEPQTRSHKSSPLSTRDLP